MGFSPWQLIIVLVIVLLIFGPKKLPQLARSIGTSVGELKKGLSGLNEDMHDTSGAGSKSGPAPSSHAEKETEAQPVEHPRSTHNTDIS